MCVYKNRRCVDLIEKTVITQSNRNERHIILASKKESFMLTSLSREFRLPAPGSSTSFVDYLLSGLPSDAIPVSVLSESGSFDSWYSSVVDVDCQNPLRECA